MLKVSGPVGATAFVSMFLLSGAAASLTIDSARADNCLAAPKTASPSGQHWYYHIDRATRRKCWYLHAAVQLGHRAVIRHHAAEPAAPADAEPVAKSQTASEPQTSAEPQTMPAPAAMADPPAQPVAPPASPEPDSAAGDTPPAPHVTVLTVRPSTPFVTTAAAPQQSTAEKAPSLPAPQMLPRDDKTPAIGVAKPADTAPSTQPQDKADAAYHAPVQTADAAADTARMKTAEMFILLALVFGAAAAVIALVSKILGFYRRPRISDDPDAAWLRYRSAHQRIDAESGYDEEGVPFVDPEEHYGLADLHEQEWLDRSSPAQNRSESPPRAAGFTQPQSPQPNPSDIGPALRALRQARQSRVD